MLSRPSRCPAYGSDRTRRSDVSRAPLALTFETAASKSAVADFDISMVPKSGRPDFGAISSG